MFLQYNFHLHEAKNKNLIEGYLNKIKIILNKELTEENFYEIKIYGIEAFFYASLKTLSEAHLFEGWKKMSHLWTIINQKKIKEEEKDRKHLDNLKKAIKNNDYFKIATSFDHLLKKNKDAEAISKEYVETIKDIFPFLLYKM
ncbi:hypothetical protein [Alphaproteobacteria bacterium endosymbiont of Tiliacea citrago]|uniref:hypothetical protein n=1 Tax=Alphaproteobacteria bacterium endosymbiont of Tiliacea citrago TaxID=3077944 RepID=UPI00313B336A